MIGVIKQTDIDVLQYFTLKTLIGHGVKSHLVLCKFDFYDQENDIGIMLSLIHI